MNAFWWLLPGPAGFVARVVRDIRKGNQVILALPRHLPGGIKPEIRRELGDAWPWFSLPGALEQDPASYLHERFMPQASPECLHTPEALIETVALHNRVFWLHLQTHQESQTWLPFLKRYRAACQAYGRNGPAQLVVVLEGDATHDMPAAAPCLKVRLWRNVGGGLESMLYADHCLQSLGLSILKRQVAASTCARIALWDPGTTAYLADRYEDFLQNPVEMLADLARSRGWTADAGPSWAHGQVDTVDGEERVHSAFYALQNDRRELDRRIWKGQVAVLFPFLEERRRELLETKRHTLYAPFETNRNGYTRYVDHIEELEFADIQEQLRTGFPYDSEALKLVGSLKATRDKLAHLEPLSEGELKEFFSAVAKRVR